MLTLALTPSSMLPSSSVSFTYSPVTIELSCCITEPLSPYDLSYHLDSTTRHSWNERQLLPFPFAFFPPRPGPDIFDQHRYIVISHLLTPQKKLDPLISVPAIHPFPLYSQNYLFYLSINPQQHPSHLSQQHPSQFASVHCNVSQPLHFSPPDPFSKKQPSPS